jgi:hypothetical protein
MAFVKERGTIAVMSEVQFGTSQSGNTWSRQTIVVDVVGYNGNYRKVMLQASGNVVADLETMMVGDKVEITYQVTAREWNGKWYNNVDLYKIESTEEKAQQPVAPSAPSAPAYPQNPQSTQPRVRGRQQTTPLVPPGHNDPQDDDFPF